MAHTCAFCEMHPRSHRWIFLTRACNTGLVVLPAVSLKKLLNTQSRCRCLGVIWYDWSIVTKSCRPPVNSPIGEYLITANKAQQNHVQLFVKCYQVRNIRYCMIPLNHQPQYQEYNSGYLNGYRKVFFMATRVCICGQVPYSISYETCWWAWNMVNSYYTFSITIKEYMTWLLGGLVTQLNTFYDISRILQIINTIRSVVNFVVDWIYTYSAELFIPLPHTKKKHSNTDLV